MSELLAMSFDADASPVVRFHDPGPDAQNGTPRLYGWGMGWYPNSERGASVIKDPSFRDKLEEQGAQFMSVNAKQAQDFLVKEMKLWAPMVEASGIEPPNN